MAPLPIYVPRPIFPFAAGDRYVLLQVYEYPNGVAWIRLDAQRVTLIGDRIYWWNRCAEPGAEYYGEFEQAVATLDLVGGALELGASPAGAVTRMIPVKTLPEGAIPARVAAFGAEWAGELPRVPQGLAPPRLEARSGGVLGRWDPCPRPVLGAPFVELWAMQGPVARQCLIEDRIGQGYIDGVTSPWGSSRGVIAGRPLGAERLYWISLRVSPD